MENANQIVTDRIKLALGELIFDKIQLVVQAELLQQKITELEKKEDTD